MISDNPTTKLNRILVSLACLVVIMAGVKLAADILVTFLAAVVLTIVLYPLIGWMLDRGVPRALAVVLLLVIVALASAATFTLIYVYVSQLLDNLPRYQALLQQQLAPLQQVLSSYGLHGDAITNSGILPSVEESISIVLSGIQGLAANLFGLAIFLLLLLLLVSAAPQVTDRFQQQLGHRSPFILAAKQYSHEVQKVYAIQTLSNVLTASAVTIVLWLLGVDFAIFWGILIFFFSYIPNIGGILAAIPPTLMAFIVLGPAMALVVLALFALISSVMDNVVTPRFQGQAFDIPVFMVFSALIVWSWLFGAMGVLLAMPLTLAVKSLLQHIPAAAPLSLLFTSQPPSSKMKSE